MIQRKKVWTIFCIIMIQIPINMAFSQRCTFFFNLDLEVILMNAIRGHSPKGRDENNGRASGKPHLLSTTCFA